MFFYGYKMLDNMDKIEQIKASLAEAIKNLHVHFWDNKKNDFVIADDDREYSDWCDNFVGSDDDYPICNGPFVATP